VRQKGKRLEPLPPLSAIRDHALSELATLPESLKKLDKLQAHSVHISRALQALTAMVDGQKIFMSGLIRGNSPGIQAGVKQYEITPRLR